MSEEAAIYRGDNAAWINSVQGLRAQLHEVQAERDRLELRIRELEDAILIHHKNPMPKRSHDEWLYEEVAYLLWT